MDTRITRTARAPRTTSTLTHLALVATIRTLDLTSLGKSDIPADIQALIHAHLRKTVQTIENFLIKTFVSPGVMLRSGSSGSPGIRHGYHAYGEYPWTPRSLFDHTCFWFGKEHGLSISFMDDDPPIIRNYRLGHRRGPEFYPVNIQGDMQYQEVQDNTTVHYEPIVAAEDMCNREFRAITGEPFDQSFLQQVSRVPVVLRTRYRRIT